MEFFSAREVVVKWGSLEVRWYGVLYLVAFAVVWWLLPKLQKYRDLELKRDEWLYVLTWGIGGVLIGGRLGFVFFYELELLANPINILALWQGGMSWHGGLIGVALVLWAVSGQLKVNFLKLTDVVVMPAALGLALGRVGNVINQELFLSGWVQFWAVAQNILIVAVVFWVLKNKKMAREGLATATFMIMYGVLRFIIEFWRVQDYTMIWGLSRGQVLSIVVLAVGSIMLNNKLQITNIKQMTNDKY